MCLDTGLTPFARLFMGCTVSVRARLCDRSHVLVPTRHLRDRAVTTVSASPSLPSTLQLVPSESVILYVHRVRVGHSASLVEKTIVLFGGCRGRKWLADVFALDTGTKQHSHQNPIKIRNARFDPAIDPISACVHVQWRGSGAVPASAAHLPARARITPPPCCTTAS